MSCDSTQASEKWMQTVAMEMNQVTTLHTPQHHITTQNSTTHNTPHTWHHNTTHQNTQHHNTSHNSTPKRTIPHNIAQHEPHIHACVNTWMRKHSGVVSVWFLCAALILSVLCRVVSCFFCFVSVVFRPRRPLCRPSRNPTLVIQYTTHHKLSTH